MGDWGRMSLEFDEGYSSPRKECGGVVGWAHLRRWAKMCLPNICSAGCGINPGDWSPGHKIGYHLSKLQSICFESCILLRDLIQFMVDIASHIPSAIAPSCLANEDRMQLVSHISSRAVVMQLEPWLHAGLASSVRSKFGEKPVVQSGHDKP